MTTSTATLHDLVRELLRATEPGAHVLVIGAASQADLEELVEAGLNLIVRAPHGAPIPAHPADARGSDSDARHLPCRGGALAGIWVHLGDFDQQAARQALEELAWVSRSGAPLLFTGRQALAGASRGNWEATSLGREWIPRSTSDELTDALLSAGWVPDRIAAAVDESLPGVIHLHASAALL